MKNKKMNYEEISRKYLEEIHSLKEKNIFLEKCLEQSRAAYDSIHHMFQELRRYRFGQKSERFLDNPQQGSLFGELFPDLSGNSEQETEKEIEIPAHKRKKKKTKKDL